MNGNWKEVSVSINLVVGHGSALEVKQVEATVRFCDERTLEQEIERVTSGIKQLVGATIRNEVAMGV